MIKPPFTIYETSILLQCFATLRLFPVLHFPRVLKYFFSLLPDIKSSTGMIIFFALVKLYGIFGVTSPLNFFNGLPAKSKNILAGLYRQRYRYACFNGIGSCVSGYRCQRRPVYMFLLLMSTATSKSILPHWLFRVLYQTALFYFQDRAQDHRHLKVAIPRLLAERDR